MVFMIKGLDSMQYHVECKQTSSNAQYKIYFSSMFHTVFEDFSHTCKDDNKHNLETLTKRRYYARFTLYIYGKRCLYAGDILTRDFCVFVFYPLFVVSLHFISSKDIFRYE